MKDTKSGASATADGSEFHVMIVCGKSCSCSMIQRPKSVCTYWNGLLLFDLMLRVNTALQAHLPTGLPRSGKKLWKMKKFPGQGKVRELHFQSGKFASNLCSETFLF